jgi:Beta-galactosidase
VGILCPSMLRRLVVPALAALVVVLLVVILRGGSGDRSPVRPAGLAIGVNATVIFDTPGMPAALVERQLAGMEKAGVTLVRTDALWFRLEPAPGRFDWTSADGIASALARHGIRWWPVMGYAPSWAAAVEGSLHAPPRDPADYGRFVGAFAARYGQGGAFWREHPELPALPIRDYELWNEPNGGFFWPPSPDPVAYAALFAAGAGALKAADPAGQAILGGMEPSRRWVPALLAARPQIRSEIDGVAVHPYGTSPAAVLRHVEALRVVLIDVGLPSVPVDVTEVGWETSPATARWFATDEQRAHFIVQTGRALARPALGVGAYLPYAWTTAERDPANEDDWYGIVPAAGTTEDTPGTRAIRALTGMDRAP